MENIDASPSKEHSDYTSQREERLRNADFNLGIDNEVVLVKRRQAIAKLDDNLLLSSAGLPKLRRISKNKLKLRAKGHEFSNVAQILKLYQLWLDDMYPRAKFSDGLSMIEKLGHSKRVQVYRRQWIEEGKPNRSDSYSADIEADIDGTNIAGPGDDNVPDQTLNSGVQLSAGVAEMTNSSGEPIMHAGRESSVPEADELDALLYENS